MASARVRLGCLWLSQTARVLADWCLRLFVVLELARAGERQLNSAWYLATAVYIAPFILLAPTNGALSNALRKRRVLIGSAAFCLAALALFGARGGPWLVCLGCVAVGMAVYSPTRYALLPAAAEDTGVPLPRVTGWIEMGGALAIVAGAILGRYLHEVHWGAVPLPAAVAAALGFCIVGLLAAVPVRFAADVYRPEPPGQAVAGFFRDARRVFRSRSARGSLLGLTAFMALVTAGAGALFNLTLGPSAVEGKEALLRSMVLLAVGGAAGSWLAGLPGDLDRCLGLVPLAATGLLAALAWATAAADPTWPALLLGVTTGMANVPLRSFYQASVPADARGNGMAVMNTAIFAGNTALSLVMFLLTYFRVIGGARQQVLLLAGVAVAATALGWWVLWPRVQRLW